MSAKVIGQLNMLSFNNALFSPLYMSIFVTSDNHFDFFAEKPNVSSTSYEENNSFGEGTSKLQLLGYLLPIATGIILSIDVILVKQSQYLMENYLTATYWSCVTSAIISAVTMAIFEDLVLPENWEQVLLVAGHSVTFVFHWPLYAYAAKYLSGNTVNLIQSTSVVFMLIAQYTVLSSVLPGHRNWIEVLGVGLVLTGSVAKSLLEFS